MLPGPREEEARRGWKGGWQRTMRNALRTLETNRDSAICLSTTPGWEVNVKSGVGKKIKKILNLGEGRT